MKLDKSLNIFHVFAICSGAMLSGLFILPGLAYEIAGPAILLSFVIAGFLAMTGMLSQAELTSAMPKAGGTYFYVTRTMGPAIGSVYGFITWLSLSLKSAYELVFIAAALSLLFKISGEPLIAVGLCFCFLLVNVVGVRNAGRAQLFMVSLIFVALGVFVGWGLPNIEIHNFDNFSPKGLSAVISASGFVFISFGGLLKVASMAEEVRDPGKSVPRGMIYSLLVIMGTYLIVVFVTIGLLGADNLTGIKGPIADAANSVMGGVGKYIFAAVGIMAVASAANTGIMSASRYPLALARDEVFPSILGRVSSRFKTPYPSIAVTGGLVIAAIFVPTDLLIKAASGVLIVTYLFTCLVVVILREGRIQNYQPEFKSPLYPWIQIVGIAGLSALLLEIGAKALIANAVLVVGGFIAYYFFGSIKTNREFALLHLIERITATEITNHSLETELKEIIRERDGILKDRFDHIIEESEVLDIEGACKMEEFFRQAADLLAAKLEDDPEKLYHDFLERETESSTVLNPYLAIPHIIIEGEEEFGILLARCREGIEFSGDAPKVHAVFLLVGTRDERPFHLRALAAICQVVMDPNFDEQWMDAKSPEALRDIVLLSKRKRDTEQAP